MEILLQSIDSHYRILLVLLVAVVLHVTIRVIKSVQRKLASKEGAHLSKPKTIIGLVVSVLTFAAYFLAIGLIFSEFGISLTAYFASASIIGIAVAFGSQGLVQDVVSGLTVILSNLYDIGDIVEISGQCGVIKNVTMRFTVIENAMGAVIYIPNRSVNNVINYQRGYIRCLCDISISEQSDIASQQREKINESMIAVTQQFPGIMRRPPDIEGTLKTRTGRTIVRIKFRIWPGRGGPIENQFKQEVLQTMKKLDPDYADWMIAINYEVEGK